ncbi:unnamed protein product [Trifolium pratense]|uniref:Uncharacterized protein n=1 Tax=Trifolium pratense TaxID=57577 RepID=A0ACB0J1Y5_TRIPR|nr:unnamed protein product [Trifolium pratense]
MSSLPTGRRFLFPQINEEGRSQLILPKNRKRSAMPGRGDGKRNGSEERNGEALGISISFFVALQPELINPPLQHLHSISGIRCFFTRPARSHSNA